MGTHTVKKQAAVRNSNAFLTTAFNKSRIIRLIFSAILLIISLFTADKAVLTVILRVFSVIISVCDVLYDAVNYVAEGTFLSTPLIYITVAFVSILTGNSSEGALLCLIYQFGIIITGFVSKRTEKRAVSSIEDAESRETIKKVLEYWSATELDIKEGIEKTFLPLLLGMIVIGLLYLIALPVFGHLNIRIALKRSLVLILLAEPAMLFASFKNIGVEGICAAGKRGTVLNCVNGLYDSSGRYVISSREKNPVGYIGVKPSAMERDSFINFAVHVLCKSEHNFAKFIIDYYNLETDAELIRDSIDVEGGVTGSINGMRVLFGTYEMLLEYGIEIENPVSGRYYMYLGDRYVGSIHIEYPDESETELEDIGRRVDIFAVENASLSFIVKAILLTPAFTGFCSVSVASIIGIVISILTILNTKRIDSAPNAFDNLFSKYFDSANSSRKTSS